MSGVRAKLSPEVLAEIKRGEAGSNGGPLMAPTPRLCPRSRPERVDWLWEGRIPLGMLSMLAGDPGLGKSLLTVDIAAKVSRAGGDVLLLSAEDHAGATIRPRAEAAGADLDRIHCVALRRDGIDDGLAFPDDADALDKLVEQHVAKLVVIDPLMAHLLGSVNSWSDQDMRTALAPLHRMAEKRRCAVTFVLHLNKAKGADPTHRTGGSIAVPASVRSALLLARDPDDPDGDRGAQRVLAQFKCNLGPFADSLTCEIETIQLPGDEQLIAPRLKVIGTSQTSGADLLSAPTGEERTERTEAIEILESELESGPRRVKEVKAAVLAAGVSPRTLDRRKAGAPRQVRAQGWDRRRWRVVLGASSAKCAITNCATPISPRWRT